jgi:HSP20 family protein
MTEPAPTRVTVEVEAKAETEAKPAEAAAPAPPWRSMTALGREIDRLLAEYVPWGLWQKDAGHGVFEAEPYWQSLVKLGAAPAVDVVGKEQAYAITAEVPGINETSIEVKLADGVLKLKGEKKDEIHREKEDIFVSERSYGPFQRSFRIPDGVDTSKIEARLKDGVLTVILPKTAKAQEAEKAIPVTRG